ncbi:hypothetical protein PG994_008186 [Apiospora phragmitis]|uniref:Uncharacterized protein n=1 Tax=Apiospora phragmitis TaxID=2905665 RepID=A0ABR1UUU1_9PEZI
MLTPPFPPSSELTGIDRWDGRHAQDCCNKSLALYTIGHDPMPISNYLYRKWLRPFKNPVEFGQFIAKIVEIDLGQCLRVVSEPNSVEKVRGVVKDILRIHQQVLHDIDEECRADPDYYGILPLFYSMIIVTKEFPNGVQNDISQMQVYLVLTGDTEQMYDPARFQPNIVREKRGGQIEKEVEDVSKLVTLESATPQNPIIPDASESLKLTPT